MSSQAVIRTQDEQPDRARRIEMLRRAVSEEGHEALLVSAPANIRYLTGFSGSSGCLLVMRDSATLHTDGRYAIQARQENPALQLVVSSHSSLLGLSNDVKKRRIKRLAFERNRLSFEAYEFLRRALSGCRLQPAAQPVERLRRIKSPAEIGRIRRSVALNSEAFERVCRRLRPSWTEMRLAAEIEYEMRRLGAEGAAFPTIVAAGEHAALPHAQPGARRLDKNALILIDQGAILDGYTSDMTRMISLGRIGHRERQIFGAVREAQLAAVDAVQAGVKARTVHAKARQVLRKFKLSKAFPHSTGHGLGLEVHELPRVGPRENRRLGAGMVITIEPGAYVESVGGARIEDVVVVTRNGCEVLTPTSKDLRVL